MQEETNYKMTDEQMLNYLYSVAKSSKDLNLNVIARRLEELVKQERERNNGI